MKKLISALASICISFASAARVQSQPSRSFRRQLLVPPLPKANPSTEYADALSVTHTNDPQTAARWVDQHIRGGRSTVVVGWDVESSPNLPWRRATYVGPATVQIAVLDAALVLQIADDGQPRGKEALMETLPLVQDLLEDDTILKAGVGLDQDMLELLRWDAATATATATTTTSVDSENFAFGDMRGRFDVGGVGGQPGRTASLKTLAHRICGVDLPKSKKITTSNWARLPLSQDQIAYAARDAWASAAVVYELAQRDPAQFSSEVLRKRVLAAEEGVHVLDERATARKAAKTALRQMLENGEERISRYDLSEEEQLKIEELEHVMRELAPPRPFLFDLEPLGL